MTAHRPEIKPQTSETPPPRRRRYARSFFPLRHLKDKRATTLPAASDSTANNRLHCNAITVIYAALPWWGGEGVMTDGWEHDGHAVTGGLKRRLQH